MLRRALPALLAAVAAAILLSLVAGPVPGRAGELLFVVSVALFPSLLILLAAPRARAAALVLGALLVSSATGIVLLSADGSSGGRLFGLPTATWLMLGGLGIVPLAWVVWAHARTFVAPEAEDSDGSPHG